MCFGTASVPRGDGCIDDQAFPFCLNYSGAVANLNVGIAVGMNKGHIVRRRELPPRPSRRKGVLSQRTKAVRSLIKEVCG